MSTPAQYDRCRVPDYYQNPHPDAVHDSDPNIIPYAVPQYLEGNFPNYSAYHNVPPITQEGYICVAGTPGVIQPVGAVDPLPADLAALQAADSYASPPEAWTEGQSVVLGDGSDAHWDGTAWVAGVAPAPLTPPVFSGPIPDQTGTTGVAITNLDLSTFFDVSGSGGNVVYSTDVLPGGLSLDPATGIISGTPSTVETVSVTATCTADGGATNSNAFSWTVSAP